MLCLQGGKFDQPDRLFNRYKTNLEMLQFSDTVPICSSKKLLSVLYVYCKKGWLDLNALDLSCLGIYSITMSF